MKIVRVGLGKVGRLDVIVMLDAEGIVRRAIYAATGTEVEDFKEISNHFEDGCFKIA